MNMRTEVVMPQMGESIVEGTVARWMKKVGDRVERDELLLEISTDKVNAEIPSPVAGIVMDIRVQEGETVNVNTVIAIIGDGAAASDGETARPARDSAAAGSKSPTRAPLRSSPLVRNIARKHNADLTHVQGTGTSGRITKSDIIGFIESSHAEQHEHSDRVEKMSVMRRRIADHMILSRRTSAHVHSVVEVNFAKVAAARQIAKAESESTTAKLTYLSFIAKAAIDALHAVPIINASIDGEDITYHRNVNLGIAVALDWGLIVPVIKNAEEMDLLGLTRAIAEVAARARSKRLRPEDVQGGTFTITNTGTSGALFGLPIINQPQVAILGVGRIEKRPVVIGDGLAIRHMGYLTLGFDHRLIDGAVADGFLANVKATIEDWRPSGG